jgi:2,4-dienoyl-CoA reductase-like NADH-dependent reductase (Old Yellow Enzyme family)
MSSAAGKIRHPLPIMRAPTVPEAAGSRLFSPCTLASGLRLNERSWVPAMVPWRATDDGFVTSAVLDWYERFAEGEPGVIVVEATGIRDVPSGPLLRIGHDRFLPGLRTLVERVRQKSAGRTRLFIQCIDFLQIKRRPPREKFILRFLRVDDALRGRLAEHVGDPSLEHWPEEDIRGCVFTLSDESLRAVLDRREYEALAFGLRERVTDVEQPQIRDLPQVLPGLFADAAARARDVGFDGIELHYAHAYTMASFLSALNTRADGYGGPREQRVRLPIEVYRAVRARVGQDYTVGCRFLCDETIEGGSTVDDAAYFGVELARAGMDFLSLSTGGKFEDAKQPKVGEASYPYTGPSGHECMPTALGDERGPFARNVPKQAEVRAAVRAAGLETPVVVAGGICSFDQAEAILARGEGDLIGAARQSLADPDWFKKLRLGYGAEVRACTYTNYCEALDQRHRAVTCKLWDRTDLDESGAPILFEEGKSRRRLVAPTWRQPVKRSGES